jgi:hypothetical protein
MVKLIEMEHPVSIAESFPVRPETRDAGARTSGIAMETSIGHGSKKLRLDTFHR